MTGEQRLFCAVLADALKGEDALAWLASEDGRLVCSLAGVEYDYAVRKLMGR